MALLTMALPITYLLRAYYDAAYYGTTGHLLTAYLYHLLTAYLYHLPTAYLPPTI